MSTSAHLNVFPLDSYNMFLDMDWLYLHMTKVDCYDKAIKYLDENGEQRVLLGVESVGSTNIHGISPI